jgi:hypothetical protein
VKEIFNAVVAIQPGVDVRVPHSVMLEIFTDIGIGTEIVL